MPSPHHLLAMHILQLVGLFWLANLAMIGAENVRETCEAPAIIGTVIVFIFMLVSLIGEVMGFK